MINSIAIQKANVQQFDFLYKSMVRRKALGLGINPQASYYPESTSPESLRP